MHVTCRMYSDLSTCIIAVNISSHTQNSIPIEFHQSLWDCLEGPSFVHQLRPRALHSLLNASKWRSLNGFKPAFFLFFPAGTCRTFFHHSERVRWKKNCKVFVLSCITTTTCCLGPSPWKKGITSVVLTPFGLVILAFVFCKQAF